MPELKITCPDCGGELTVIHVAYECAKGHTWGDAVALHATEKSEAEAPKRTGPGSRPMPFGKHKGTPLEDLPTDYIEWVLRELKDLRSDLRDELENQLEMRAGRGVARPAEGKFVGKKFIIGGK